MKACLFGYKIIYPTEGLPYIVPSPLGTNLGFGYGWTGLDCIGVGPRGMGTKGLGPGLDNLKKCKFCRQDPLF